jgi:hypothetical protein
LILDPEGAVSASALYNHYKGWCDKNGEQPKYIKALKFELGNAFDVKHKRTKLGSEWIGVKLRT